jgi:hypothetical protein
MSIVSRIPTEKMTHGSFADLESSTLLDSFLFSQVRRFSSLTGEFQLTNDEELDIDTPAGSLPRAELIDEEVGIAFSHDDRSSQYSTVGRERAESRDATK